MISTKASSLPARKLATSESSIAASLEAWRARSARGGGTSVRAVTGRSWEGSEIMKGILLFSGSDASDVRLRTVADCRAIKRFRPCENDRVEPYLGFMRASRSRKRSAKNRSSLWSRSALLARLDASDDKRRVRELRRIRIASMRDDYLQSALKVVGDPSILVNVVSRRVKQLRRGNRPLV